MIQHSARVRSSSPIPAGNRLMYMTVLKSVEAAYRICYASEPREDSFLSVTPEVYVPLAEKFIKAKMQAGHMTPLEQATVTMTFYSDRGFTHELVRHRIGVAINQQSTRYANYSKDQFGNQINVVRPFGLDPSKEPVPVILPYTTGESSAKTNNTESSWELRDNLNFGTGLETSMNAFDVWFVAMLWAEWAYMKMIEMGVAPEWARSVLPQSTLAPIIFTANLREWRHVFELRALGLTGRPHPQMRELMVPTLKIMYVHYPVFFEDLAFQIPGFVEDLERCGELDGPDLDFYAPVDWTKKPSNRRPSFKE